MQEKKIDFTKDSVKNLSVNDVKECFSMAMRKIMVTYKNVKVCQTLPKEIVEAGVVMITLLFSNKEEIKEVRKCEFNYATNLAKKKGYIKEGGNNGRNI